MPEWTELNAENVLHARRAGEGTGAPDLLYFGTRPSGVSGSCGHLGGQAVNE